MFNKTVTAKAFVANPSNKTASITNGGLKTFSTETEYDSENGLMRSERRGKEESEKSKFACYCWKKKKYMIHANFTEYVYNDKWNSYEQTKCMQNLQNTSIKKEAQVKITKND